MEEWELVWGTAEGILGDRKSLVVLKFFRQDPCFRRGARNSPEVGLYSFSRDISHTSRVSGFSPNWFSWFRNLRILSKAPKREST